jgi:O-antigen ligase
VPQSWWLSRSQPGERASVVRVTFSDRYRALLLATVVTLPLHWILNMVFWVAFCLNSLTAPRQAWADLLRRDRMLWVYAPLVLVYALSLAWSQDVIGGLAIVETMGTFAIVSVALGRHLLTPDFATWVYRSFVATVTGCALFSLATVPFKLAEYDGWYRYFPDGTVRDHHLFYTGLSYPVMHPGYFAVYVGVAVLLLVRLGVKAERRWPYWAIGGFLVVFLVMLQGRINILSFAAVTLPWIAWRLLRQHHPMVLVGICVGLALTAVAAVQLLPEPVAGRFTEEVSLDYDLEAPRISEFSGLTIRLAEWESIRPTIQDSWATGVGLGDAQEAIREAYDESGFVVGTRRDFNAHNQYLQTWLSAGILALLALLFILAAVSREAVRSRDLLLAMAFWYFFLSMLTESMLVRNQGGTLFATVLLVMLLAPRDREPACEPDPVTTP